MSEPPPARVCSLENCSAPAVAGACSQCHTAWYCSREHQRAAWSKGGQHRKWCKLVGESVDGSSCGSITFVGQGAGKELAQHATLSLGAARKAGEAAARKAGYEAAKDVTLGEHAAAGGEGGYCGLAKKINLKTLRATWPDESLVVKRRRFLLTLGYCIGTQPVFLVTAPEGARGFTCADLVSACARCYQWAYEKELPAGTYAPRMGGLINRGFTNGPFKISMREWRRPGQARTRARAR